jgi:hypothetical protein
LKKTVLNQTPATLGKTPAVKDPTFKPIGGGMRSRTSMKKDDHPLNSLSFDARVGGTTTNTRRKYIHKASSPKAEQSSKDDLIIAADPTDPAQAVPHQEEEEEINLPL